MQVKGGKVAPFFHCMFGASLLSFGAMYPYALEEHIEKNPSRFFRGQLGLTMKDYLAPVPDHHFTKCVSFRPLWLVSLACAQTVQAHCVVESVLTFVPVFVSTACCRRRLRSRLVTKQRALGAPWVSGPWCPGVDNPEFCGSKRQLEEQSGDHA